MYITSSQPNDYSSFFIIICNITCANVLYSVQISKGNNDIYTTSDISKLFEVISLAVGRGKFETILK